MIYVEGRFLFLHIPRTAGTSITKAIGMHQLDARTSENVYISTGYLGAVDKHATLDDVKEVFGELQGVYKFAFDRPADEIIRSDYELQRRDHHALMEYREIHGENPEGYEQAWADVIEITSTQTLEQFTWSRWGSWLKGDTVWDHWTGGDETVHRYDFHDLQSEWRRLLDDLGFPSLQLPQPDES